MASNRVYEEIVYQIFNLLKQNDLYPKYIESIEEGKNDFKISQVYTKKNYSTEWIGAIEDCIVSLDNIVRNPRKFIVIEEDIVDISLARSISVESVKHLSQHTNLISSVTKEGMVIPSKILNTSKEESFEVYENRFIYTLLLKVKDFIDRRSAAIKSAMMQSGELGVDVESEFSVDKSKVRYKMSGNANFPFDAVVKKSGGGGPSDIERIARINQIISDFLASPFAREMRSCALVRPPIQRTNVILKNPDFKKALVLWQYIETNEKSDYKIETSTETVEMNPIIADKYRAMIYLNTVLMQSIANTHEASDSLESAKKKQQVIVDQYVTKNIDDYVPDDFPSLKLDLSQIRTIYKKIPAENNVSMTDLKKLNSALDRVIRQFLIINAQEKSLEKQKLVLEQMKAEREAKRLALREEKDKARKERTEKARKRLEIRKTEDLRKRELELLKKKEEELRLAAEKAEREAAEKEAEQKRLDEENRLYWENVLKVEEEKTAAFKAEQAEARRILEETQKDYDRAIAEFNAREKSLEESRRKNIEYNADQEAKAAAREAEREAIRKVTEEDKASAVRIAEEKVSALKRMEQESQEYWLNEWQVARDLGIKQSLAVISEKERKEMEAILSNEREVAKVLRKLEKGFSDNLYADELAHMRKMLEIAYRFRTEPGIQDAIIKERKELRKEMRKRIKQERKDKRDGKK
ncbi:MAG: hypothetical protein MR239_00750 [Clostridiales bacterium]|nr:hypothetical protein [Clostridiales bacterium]